MLAPKTIDNDLGLNYPNEPDEWVRRHGAGGEGGFRYKRAAVDAPIFDLDQMVNYVTPGYATAVFVSATAWSASARRPRATAASPSSR